MVPHVQTFWEWNLTCCKIAWSSKLASHQQWFSAFTRPKIYLLTRGQCNILMNIWSIENLGHMQIIQFMVDPSKSDLSYPDCLGHPTHFQPCAIPYHVQLAKRNISNIELSMCSKLLVFSWHLGLSDSIRTHDQGSDYSKNLCGIITTFVCNTIWPY